MPKVAVEYKEPRKNRQGILEDVNFFWDEPELKQMANMWERGWDLEKMAKYFDRDEDEVFLALFHLARQGKIERRKVGLG